MKNNFFYVGVFLMNIIVSSSKASYQSDLKKFLTDCSPSTSSKTSKTCETTKTSYILWVIRNKSKETAVYCLISQLKDDRISGEQKQQHWLLLSYLLKSKQCSKQALKLANSKEKVKLFSKWAFLGPFQIGKQELDGDASFFKQNSIKNRWNKKFKLYSELVSSGVVRWTELTTANSDGTVQISPPVDWNDLVMSMQSMAMTEWQGVLVNDFVVTSPNLNIQIQCLGVNHFYVDDTIMNGDVYHRSEFWYPTKLNVGIHTLTVPVRSKGPGVVKCSLKVSKNKLQLHLDRAFKPDFVDGNLFSTLVSIPISNLDAVNYCKVEIFSIESQNFPGFDDVNIEHLNNGSISPGQVSSIVLNITTNVEKAQKQCPPTSHQIQLKMKFIFSMNIVKEVTLPFRCRTLQQSFLFTFLDHDGSVQQAAAVKPLKPCSTDKCPVLLTLHGTGVSAESQADSYKQMINKKFVFGVEKMWLLAPTRHGAHNWEGPGEMTSLSALQSLASLTSNVPSWIGWKSADADVVIFAGHSMGGHGAWQLSTHHPDKTLAVISAAGWLSKEDYGDSNLFYRHDVSVSYVEPSIKMIQESCVAENQADKHASNLKGLRVMMRIGASDKTVHPYFSRRMFRLLKENNVDVRYKEFQGKEHWWWDTKKENDGGVSNDLEIRNFIKSVIEDYEKFNGQCSITGGGCEETTGQTKYKQLATRTTGHFHFVVYNPASFSGGRGVLIVQQQKPLRKSTYDVIISQDQVTLKTNNIRRIRIYEPKVEPIKWLEKTKVTIDDTVLNSFWGYLPLDICKVDGVWQQCSTERMTSSRNLFNYGPARRIAEKDFVIVICDDKQKEKLQTAAVFLSNLFYLTSDAYSPIILSRDLSEDILQNKNIILLGTESCTNKMKIQKLIRLSENSAGIGACEFAAKNTSALYLFPKGVHNQILLLTSHNVHSIYQDVLKLAVPTIPPMTRSPFSNLLPDYVILTPDVGRKGPGGYLCSGFWDNDWAFDESLSSCFC